MASLARGSFVSIADSDDGVGKLIDVVGSEGQVEYFVSPAGPALKRVRAPLNRLRAVELSPQTRVYWYDDERHAWTAGRVDGGLVSALALPGATEDHYHVRFPNRRVGFLRQSHLYVRWNQPIDDPTDYLAARITDTPFFFDGRSEIVRYLSTHRAAFGGITGLASAAVDLLEHQVTTVRRVLEDPVERYLLADEVGLGKTIEAGILVRQHLLDHPRDARVLIITPPHLVDQWRTELSSKFFLSPGANLVILADSGLSERRFPSLTMLVVDEAHRVASQAFQTPPSERSLFETIRRLAVATPRVLLLSGTPVLHQEDGFLAMLHLLDPNGYRLTDRTAFRRRVADRQLVAEAMADLADHADEVFAQDTLARLEQNVSGDKHLMQLCRRVRECLPAPHSDQSRVHSLRALRVHLAETYRLHRRLLRTRRDDPRISDHLPVRSGCLSVDHEDHARNEAFDLLDTWRLGVPILALDDKHREAYSALFALWVEAALSHPSLLLRHLAQRLALLNRVGHHRNTDQAESLLAEPAFDAEAQFLRDRCRILETSLGSDARSASLTSWLQANTTVRKALVFVDNPQIADAVARFLASRLGETFVLRHGAAPSAEHRFLGDPKIRVLVCDRSAEDGLNLQRVSVTIVHYDLPLDPARIEQRIGRVDRIAARGRMRNVTLLSESRYEQTWFHCVADTIRVFDRSVAPLQHALVAATAHIRASLLEVGSEAIDTEAAELRHPETGLDAELQRVRQQEALDSLESNPVNDGAFFEALRIADENADAGGNAFDAWVVRRLQFDRDESRPETFRYVHSLRRPTLVPLYEVVTRCAKVIDRSGGGKAFELPLQPATFARHVAEERGVTLLRLGHAFVDAMEALVRADDRGAAFAMWRYVPGRPLQPSEVFLRFDFVVEADLRPAEDLLSQGHSSQAIRRRSLAAFPPHYHTVWLDLDLALVRDDILLPLLMLPFSKLQRPDGGSDVNLRPDRWARADTHTPLGDWADLCIRARRVAEQSLRGQHWFEQSCRDSARSVRETAERIDEQFRSRISHLAGATRRSETAAATNERHISEAIAVGIESPGVRVDSVGVIYLSGTRFPRDDE